MLVFLAEDSLAEVEYRRALELEPARAVTLQELSLVALFRGRFAEALRWADSAAAVEPRLARAYEERAIARLGLGDVAGARADVERSVGLGSGPLLEELHAMRAVVLAASGDSAEARREAESAAAARSSAGKTVAPLAFAALGDTGRALDLFEAFPSVESRCYTGRFPPMMAMRGDPRFDRLTASCPWRK